MHARNIQQPLHHLFITTALAFSWLQVRDKDSHLALIVFLLGVPGFGARSLLPVAVLLASPHPDIVSSTLVN